MNRAQTGTMPCTDENFSEGSGHIPDIGPSLHPDAGGQRLDRLPLSQGVSVDPMERLAKVRAMFFPDGRSLG